MAQITKLLRAVQVVSDFFADLQEEDVALKVLPQIVNRLTLLPDVTRRMLSSIDDDGRVLDGASSELRAIRKSISATQGNIGSNGKVY